MNRYRNISGVEQSVIGFGIVKAGQVVETSLLLENPNFEPLTEEAAAPAAQSEEAPTQPANQNQE